MLLTRLSCQSGVVIGTPVANRRCTDADGLAGPSANTLALRVELASDPCVSELLSQVKATTLGGYAHQDVPLEQVVEALQPARSPSHNTLFQVLLAVDEMPGGDALRPLRQSPSPPASPRATTLFDLSLSLADTGEQLVGSLEYASELFDESTVSRWLQHFVCVLEAMVADDGQRVSKLPLLNEAERTRLLVEFNATATDYPRDGLIHVMFESQVALTPDALAIVHEGDQVSYAELNRRANRVAHRLLSLGVKPDDRVAICVERSVELVVGLLGILKAGGAYVPLDPAYPTERLEYMFSDSRPLALLTQAHLRKSVSAWLPAAGVVPVVELDGEESQSSKLPEHNPEAHAKTLKSSHLAYVIYTSGSTGQPKGVMVEHHSALNFWQVMKNTTHRACPPQSRAGLEFGILFRHVAQGFAATPLGPLPGRDSTVGQGERCGICALSGAAPGRRVRMHAVPAGDFAISRVDG